MKSYLCLPLKKNIKGGRFGWALTECPICGQECWESDIARILLGAGNMQKSCTICALREGGKQDDQH